MTKDDKEIGGKAGEKTVGMKSAYELALERMESRGIDKPRQDLSDEVREQVAEVRRRASAKLAELEILRRDHPGDGEEAEDDYVRERRRVEERRDRDIERLRQGSS